MRYSDEDLPIVLSFDFRIFFNSPLTDINISGNKISGDGKRAIGKALLSSSTSKLQFLTCDEWSIRPDTTELSLVGKRLGPADAQLMAGVIKFNSALKTLDLRNNEIGDEGGKVIRDAWQGKDADLKL